MAAVSTTGGEGAKEVGVVRGRWPPFDNGAQVSLGNRRDLTQDA